MPEPLENTTIIAILLVILILSMLINAYCERSRR